jgi:hypothetical protein
VVIAVLVVSLTGLLAAGNHGPTKSAKTPVSTEPRSVAGAKSSPYPATLKMRRGLYDAGDNRALPWGTVLSAAQSRSVTIKSSGRRRYLLRQQSDFGRTVIGGDGQ